MAKKTMSGGEVAMVLGATGILWLLALPQWALVAWERSILWSFVAEPYHLPAPGWGWFWVFGAVLSSFYYVRRHPADEEAEKDKDPIEKAVSALVWGVGIMTLQPMFLAMSICFAHFFRGQGWLV